MCVDDLLTIWAMTSSMSLLKTTGMTRSTQLVWWHSLLNDVLILYVFVILNQSQTDFSNNEMHGNAQPDGRPSGGSDLQSYFRRLWTKEHWIKCACAGVSVVCNAVFWLTMSCCFPEIFPTKSRSCVKSCRNFDVFGPPNFGGRGHPDFWPNMWQSLVTIGQVSSEIRRRKKEKKI